MRRYRQGDVFDLDGIDGLLRRAGHGGRGLSAAQFPYNGRDHSDDQDHDQQVDQIDLTEQTAFFINEFHAVPPKEFA